MFGPTRRFPFIRGLALVALGFLLASALAGGGSAASGAAAGFGLALLIPLFLVKMLFLFMLFGAMLRFAGAGGRHRGPDGWGRGPWHDRRPGTTGGDDRYPWERDDSTADHERDRRDWEESLRRAREELRDHDAPSPRPPHGFEPPAPANGPQD